METKYLERRQGQGLRAQPAPEGLGLEAAGAQGMLIRAG